MTVKEILEGYGIDFSTLDFQVTDGSDSKEEIIKSIETNEIKFNRLDSKLGEVSYSVDDFDVDDTKKETILYAE